MENSGSSSNREWSDPLKRFAAVLVEAVDLRLDLVLLEFQEEKRRLLGSLFLAMVIAFLAFLGFLCLNLLLVMLFWETHRVLVVVLMCVFYLGSALSIFIWLRSRMRSESEPFSATRGEIHKDLSFLKGDKS